MDSYKNALGFVWKASQRKSILRFYKNIENSKLVSIYELNSWWSLHTLYASSGYTPNNDNDKILLLAQDYFSNTMFHTNLKWLL